LPQACVADFTDASLIVPELRERDMAGVIKELAQQLHMRGWVQDILPFYNAALIREYLSSTATGSGLAFPHARIQSLDHLRFALGRSTEPFGWGTPRRTLVQFVFVIAAPLRDSASYLHLLSGLAILGRTELLLAELKQAQTPQRILEILKKLPLRTAEVSQLAAC
jgi:PTS system fructose-specific IIC component